MCWHPGGLDPDLDPWFPSSSPAPPSPACPPQPSAPTPTPSSQQPQSPCWCLFSWVSWTVGPGTLPTPRPPHLLLCSAPWSPLPTRRRQLVWCSRRHCFLRCCPQSLQSSPSSRGEGGLGGRGGDQKAEVRSWGGRWWVEKG